MVKEQISKISLHRVKKKKERETNNQGLDPGHVVSGSRINPPQINLKACSELRSNVYTQGSKLWKLDNHKADVGPEKTCRLDPHAVQKAAAIANRTETQPREPAWGGEREAGGTVVGLCAQASAPTWVEILAVLLTKDK